jgi:hypothetical protein
MSGGRISRENSVRSIGQILPLVMARYGITAVECASGRPGKDPERPVREPEKVVPLFYSPVPLFYGPVMEDRGNACFIAQES